ncbi:MULTISPECIES: hypothetical protein [unclassified Chryseobacterium]|uniref:hypothetical protein n=1 Tax=unclassified Chryseobacterium TaxID=2593645 RepID=UPI000D3A71DC|nr:MULTISPECIES: hypothetical protein [unclassified Chryseobacterium]PTT76054.1 hypothetical protein DBR25_06995 [Chryseobacterium sp. HMWF001]PVV55608.1 hypothetical protein DD829_13675 [Chryseobacterium sp. HMWF035]
MKKTLLILGLATLFSCNRENENLGITEQSYSSSKTASSRSGDIGALSIDFLPNNLACELGKQIQPISTLPDPFNNMATKVKVKAEYDDSPLSGVISLPELIVKYFENRGITIQQIIYDNEIPHSGSYFANNSYKEYTFTEGRTTIPEPNGSVSTFNVLTFDNYMEKYYASMIVQNAYSKISPYVINNSIKGIRIFYEDYNCPELEEERRNLKIQVIYKLNYATHTPMLEP